MANRSLKNKKSLWDLSFTPHKAAMLCATLFVLTVAADAYAGDESGLEFTVAVDMVAESKAKKDSEASDKLEAREIEFIAYGPIDHLFDGTMSMAAHPEDGVTLFELHEAVISSSKIIPRTRFRVGQFFLGVGRLNQMHRHDWQFISAPHVQVQFFDHEGVLDSGAEVATLLPTPFFLELTVGATNGFTYGHAHTEGEKPRKPTHYGRMATFFSGSQFGLNYLGRKTSKKEEYQLTGLDFVYKKRQGKNLQLLLESEIWKRTFIPPEGDNEDSLGLWIYPQYGFGEGFYFGVRYDYFTIQSLKDAGGENVDNQRTGLVPTFTWKPSEFSTWRLAYEWLKQEQQGEDAKENHKIQLQMTYLMGAHPAHDF